MGGRTKGTRPKGSGIPAGGPGWGGAAKGEAVDRAPIAPQITSENAAEMAAKAHTPEAIAKREFDIATKEELKAILTEVARNGEHEANRMNAADKLLDRIEGKARQAVELTGANGGPLQSIGLTTNDPVEASRVYQKLVSGS